MNIKTFPNTFVDSNKRIYSILGSVLQPTLLLFLLWFPLSYMRQFLHEGGHGLVNLIYGASGSVGTAPVQLAKTFGAYVTGICSTGNVAMVKSLGAEKVIDYTQADFTQNGEIDDLIFDTVGKVGFSRCKDSLKPTGIHLTTIPTLEILPDLLGLAKQHGKKARFMATGLQPASEKIQDLLIIKELVEAGKFRSVIDRCYPLEQIAEAHRYVETGHKKGSVAITVAS